MLKNFWIGFACVVLTALVMIFIIALATLTAHRAYGAMGDCIDATCRISAADGGVGSGCVFEIGQGQVYVLTAAHVVEGVQSVRCEFWTAGHLSSPLPGQVILRSSEADAAVVAVPENAFGGILPKIIPIAAKDRIVAPGETVTSAGCANGTWSTGWKGHALGYEGGDLHFVPAPANGRSGSAIFDADGKMIVGVLRARTADNAEGIATPVQTLYEAFGKENRSQAQSHKAEAVMPVQCPGGNCPGGTCPAPGGPRSGTVPYLLPYRYQEQFRNQPAPGGQAKPNGQSPVWPTLPNQAAGADLGPTNQKLDRIADMLEDLVKSKEAVPMPSNAPAEIVDEKARKAADEARAAAEAAKASADNAAKAATDAGNGVKILGEQTLGTVSEVKKIGSLIEKLGGDPEALIQKALDRVNKVQAKLGPDAEPDDVLKGYVKDLAKEKLKEGLAGGTLEKLISAGGGLPAVTLAIFGCVIVWKLVNNKPLAIESIAPGSLAGRAAADIREHVAAAVEPIKSQIDARLSQITGVAADAKAAAEAAKAVSQVVSNQTTTTAK
jgi:hypothetical protein